MRSAQGGGPVAANKILLGLMRFIWKPDWPSGTISAMAGKEEGEPSASPPFTAQHCVTYTLTNTLHSLSKTPLCKLHTPTGASEAQLVGVRADEP